jgi:hypothetical protein
MSRLLRTAASAALLLTVQACGGSGKGAAEAVQALLAAQVQGDAKAFEAGVDRKAVRDDLRRQMIDVGRRAGLDVGGPTDAALDRMIGIDSFHLALGGAPLTAPPTLGQVGAQLKTLDKGRVCLHELSPAAPCLLTFAKEAGGWKLVGLPAGHPTFEVAPSAPRKD